MPWYIPRLLEILWDLRKWQERYNPIPGPIGPEIYLDNPSDYSDAAKAQMPDIFPISRLIPTKFWTSPGRIVTGGEVQHAWCSLLAEIERRWKAFFENKYDSLQAEVVQVKDKQELLENSMFNIEVLCAASKKLLDEERADQEGVMLVANSASSPVGYEEISEFERAVRITANGRIHRILGDERVEAKRDQYLNLMLRNSGFTPPTLFTRISAEQRRKAMDQYALFVQSRVPSDEVGQLVDGTLRLSDIGLEGQVRELLDVALSEPAFLAGSQSHTRSLELGAVS